MVFKLFLLSSLIAVVTSADVVAKSSTTVTEQKTGAYSPDVVKQSTTVKETVKSVDGAVVDKSVASLFNPYSPNFNPYSPFYNPYNLYNPFAYYNIYNPSSPYFTPSLYGPLNPNSLHFNPYTPYNPYTPLNPTYVPKSVYAY